MSGTVYDTTFDHGRCDVSRRERAARLGRRIPALFALILAASAGAQIPGAPVLQNAWATPGIVAAVDVAGGSDGSMYAAAGAWSPGTARFQLSGGVGVRTRTAGLGTGAAYGIRAAIPLSSATSAIGFAAFAGVGGASAKTTTINVPCPPPTVGCRPDGPMAGTLPLDSTTSTAEIPVGAAIGWRRAVGATHGISLYATPSYVFFTGGSKTGGLFRAAIGADAGITASLGVTLGMEFGATRGRGVGGPSGSLFGLGVSYALGRR